MSTISKITNGVLGTTRQFYLAGLGVVATVSDQGSKAFNVLVEKGQAKKAVVEEDEQKEAFITANIKRVAEKASDRVQEGVAVVLGKMGIPTQEDVRAFTASIEQLTERVNAMQKNSAA